jgi:hypothetical protein
MISIVFTIGVLSGIGLGLAASLFIKPQGARREP